MSHKMSNSPRKKRGGGGGDRFVGNFAAPIFHTHTHTHTLTHTYTHTHTINVHQVSADVLRY